MGMSLVGVSRNEHFNLAAWNSLLELAFRHGWRTAGTHLQWDFEDEVMQQLGGTEWDGGYFWNSGQTVTSKDAAALAAALERALAVPGEEGVPPQLRGQAERLARLCREGEFEIW